MKCERDHVKCEQYLFDYHLGKITTGRENWNSWESMTSKGMRGRGTAGKVGQWSFWHTYKVRQKGPGKIKAFPVTCLDRDSMVC